MEGFDHWNDAGELVLFADFGGARSGGFATDIDDGRAVIEHFAGMVESCLDIDKLAAIRK